MRIWEPKVASDPDVPVSGADSASAAESAHDLHVVRPADPTAHASAGTDTVIEPLWAVNWHRSLLIQRALREEDMRRRATRERQYCEQIRDRDRPQTAEEFFR